VPEIAHIDNGSETDDGGSAMRRTGIDTEQERVMKKLRTTVLAVVLVGLVSIGLGTATAPAASAAPAPSVTALVLYDTTGQWGFMGEQYAMLTANLVGHFGKATAKPVSKYVAGDMAKYSATIYIGSTYDEPLPASFLADSLATTKPVVWIYSNIWQLTASSPTFLADEGWMWASFDTSPISKVSYKGTDLRRSPLNLGGIMSYFSIDPAKVTVLADAVRDDGTTLPWAIRAGNFTYLGENPYSYMSESDRYLAWADILFDVLAPQTAERHRAMIRLEDVGPNSDPAQLRQIADYLYSKQVPFSVATYSVYVDPNGTYNEGQPETISLRQRPQVVAALKYMQTKGGTIIQHGRTHQYGKLNNPYNGVSGDDFEFYRAHVDANDSVIYDGPISVNSYLRAVSLITLGRLDFALVGISAPKIWEFPHYAGGAQDYKAVQDLFGKGYDRRLYFPGYLQKKTIDYSKHIGQFFPYDVVDVYGTKVIPENAGNYEPEAFNNHPAVLVPDLVERARLNLTVRDGFASYFYHPYYGLEPLQQLVEGVNSLGAYTWVAPGSV